MKKLIVFLVSIVMALQAFSQAGVTVVTPNGGENWVIGCPGFIQWITTPAGMTVKLELFKDDAYCLTICNQVPAGMTSFTWIPPFNLVAGTTFKVKVSAITSAIPVFDFSDNNFSINQGSITVGAPNGGETWVKGTMHPILWTANICNNVRIELWKGGLFNMVIAASTPSNGAFHWMIPNVATLVPGNDYKVKIISLGVSPAATNLVFDFSNNNFAILEGQNTQPVVLVKPNGGENWIMGCPGQIQWITPVAPAPPVKLELYKNDLFHMTICAQVPAGQTMFTWVPPYTLLPGNNYKVKVTLLTNTGGFDFSNNNFSINRGTINVVSPNGGETWVKGTMHPILWTDNICENVRLELWKGGVFNKLIAASVPSSGSFNWMVPNINTLLPGTDYKIKIISLVNATTSAGTVFDFSDNFFSIAGVPGTSTILVSNIKVHPNPFADRLRITFPGALETPVVFDIIDIGGNVVLTQPGSVITDGETLEINTSGLQHGKYLLVVRQGRSIISRHHILLVR